MPYNRYKLKCYGSCLVAPYMVLAEVVDSRPFSIMLVKLAFNSTRNSRRKPK